MSKYLHTVCVAFALLLCLKANAQAQFMTSTSTRTQPQGEFSVFSSITKYLAAGDEVALSSWFADNLDVTVLSTSRNCSKKQAREILRSFFASNSPRSFQVSNRASEAI